MKNKKHNQPHFENYLFSINNLLNITALILFCLTMKLSAQPPSVPLSFGAGIAFNPKVESKEKDYYSTISPIPSTSSIQTFAIIGDYGSSGSNEAAVANLVKSWDPDFIITLGDNNYESGSSSTIDANIGKYYHIFIYPYSGSYGEGASSNKFFPCIGDEDLPSNNGAAYYQYFKLPGNERYYDYIKGDIHFFVLNSNKNEKDGVSSSSKQAMWLKNKLQNSTSKWNVVYVHHPPYCSRTPNGSNTYMRWPFKSWGADVVLSGHSHVYERLIEDGIPYFVNGVGGKSRHPFASTPVSGSKYRYNSNYGAMRCKEYADNLTFSFYNKDGTLKDYYILTKNKSQSDLGELTPTPSVELVSAGSRWKYLDNGTNQGKVWKLPAFNDSTWKTGNTEFGYGNSTENSLVSYGGSPTNKYITTYFRKYFNVSDKSAISGLELSLIRDDGAVVYINGEEVYRINLPPGLIYFNTLAPEYVEGKDESAYDITNISSSSLINGNNLIAVEIHQNALTSSDISFNLKLNTLGVNPGDSVTLADSLPTISQINDTVNAENHLHPKISEDKYDMIVYPNPTTGHFNLELCVDDLQEKTLIIEVTNSFGKTVYRNQPKKINDCVNELITLDANLPLGVYIMKVSIDNKIETKNMLLAR